MQKTRHIHIKGARVHNLRNVDLDLPQHQMVVFTGVSGSGKSSLVFDTLYAEGHRRYVESLSSYARQFLARLPKPDVDDIKGLSPAIAIEQRSITSNPRSTVGSITEIFDYLRLLFARIGITVSPVTGQPVGYDSVTDVVEAILALPLQAQVLVLAPLPASPRSIPEQLNILLQMGFARLWTEGGVVAIEALLEDKPAQQALTLPLVLVVDRFKNRGPQEPDFAHRVADSVQTAYNEGQGRCQVWCEGQPVRDFSEHFEQDGIRFEKPTVNLFNPNNPIGACPECEGFGRVMGVDPELVMPDPFLSLKDGAVKPWQGPQSQNFLRQFLRQVPDFPADVPIVDLEEKWRQLLWKGGKGVYGVQQYFEDLERQMHKVQNRVTLARYRGYTTCPGCNGQRLKPEALYVQVHGKTMGQLQELPIDDLARVMAAMPFTDTERAIARRLIHEVESRLRYLQDVGLGYLSLSRKASTLSGGETQRINLATSLGSTLTGSLYILDEPSIGLHPRDTDRLIGILHHLRNRGNTVVVVEHDESIMHSADYLVDMGPRAGELGGQVVAAGSWQQVTRHPDSLTAQYLNGTRQVPLPARTRQPQHWVELLGASAHNLRNVDVRVPLGCLVGVTGVSGSGKTTLFKSIFYPALCRALDLPAAKPLPYRALNLPEGLEIDFVELVDQRALGRNLRSNPVTYVGAYDGIRDLFSKQPEAKAQLLKPASFSFNVDGGRCDTCQGEGYTTVEMQFLPDVKLVCDTCQGRRFKEVVLQVRVKGKDIHEVLNLTVDEALPFFAEHPKIVVRLQVLQDVGLGYLRLGQSTSTLSGGEAQRLKLASFLQEKPGEHTLYIFDEPTTGLHFYDVEVLMQAFQALVDRGNTVVVIEHHPDVIKCADWVIDLGPEGGTGGGRVVFAGTPQGLANCAASHTGRYIKAKLPG